MRALAPDFSVLKVGKRGWGDLLLITILKVLVRSSDLLNYFEIEKSQKRQEQHPLLELGRQINETDDKVELIFKAAGFP